MRIILRIGELRLYHSLLSSLLHALRKMASHNSHRKTTFQMTRPPYVFPNPLSGRYQKIRMKRTNISKINIM